MIKKILKKSFKITLKSQCNKTKNTKITIMQQIKKTDNIIKISPE